LQGIIANPDKSVSELPLLTRAEQRQLTRWNHTSVEYPSQLTLNELFEAQVDRTPRATAIVYQDERLSYAELNEKADRLGDYLRSLCVGPETLVGILLERSPLMIVGILGVLKAGAAYVPLDINYPRERLQFTLQDARAQVLLTQTAWLDTVSTTCGSGWVRSRVATDLPNTGVKAAHPPATAGGTDCVQHRILTFEAKTSSPLTVVSDLDVLTEPNVGAQRGFRARVSRLTGTLRRVIRRSPMNRTERGSAGSTFLNSLPVSRQP